MAEHELGDEHGPTEHEQDQHGQVVSEQDRMDFLRRIMTVFAAAVVLVTVAVLVLVLAFVNTNVSRSIRKELREHEASEAEGRERVQDFVAREHVATRKQVARFQKRIAQLEDFILKQGLEVPRNGFVSGQAVQSPTAPSPAEGEKPGTPGGAPDPPPPHPVPEVPGPPPFSPGPPLEPPVPTPRPTATCIDLPDLPGLPDPAPFCV